MTPGEIIADIDAAIASTVRRMARTGATTEEILDYLRAWDRRIEATGHDPDALSELLREAR